MNTADVESTRKRSPLYQRALESAESLFGANHVRVSRICNNFAVLYKYTGEFDRAEQLYRRVLTIMGRTLGPEHPDVASI